MEQFLTLSNYQGQ